MNEIPNPRPDQPNPAQDAKSPGASSPADGSGKGQAGHADAGKGQPDRADAARAAEVQRARAAETAKFRDAYLASQKTATATADHTGGGHNPDPASKAARPRDSAAPPARADHAEAHGQPRDGAAAAREPGGQAADTPGRNVSAGVVAEEVAKRTYFPEADWTSRSQKAVDLTADARPSYSVYRDADGVNRIDEKRNGGEWIQVKVLQSDKPGKMPDNLETKVKQHVNLAMDKYIDLLDHPDSTRNSPKWQKYTADTQWRLTLSDPERIRVHIEVPGLDPASQKSLQRVAQEQADLHAKNVRPGVQVVVEVVPKPPEPKSPQPTGRVEVGRITVVNSEDTKAVPTGTQARQGGPADDQAPQARMGEARMGEARMGEARMGEAYPGGTHPGFAQRIEAKGASEGAALMINQGQAHYLEQVESDKEQVAIAALKPEISRLRHEGKWVAISVVTNEPRIFDFGRDIVRTPDQISRFHSVVLNSGDTRQEAVNPPRYFQMPPSASQRPESLDDSRRYRTELRHVFEPIPARQNNFF